MIKTEDTKRIFFDAFALVGADKPLKQITVSAVSRKAGFNRSTFYEYFDGIEDLYLTVESLIISEVKKNFEEIITKTDFKKTFLLAFEKIQGLYPLYFDLLLNQYNYTSFAEKLIKEVSPALVIKFSLPQNHPRSFYLVEVYFYSVLSALKYWIGQDRKISLAELSEIIQTILSDGVMSEIRRFSRIR